ncbi:MAG: NADH-quinone oxidoreductase subunit D [Proteobacteria bacterium]|nr:MAG: NADH-quinone oxidoreductase subunit D [Pseudomonadota bacterium]
MSRDTIPMQVGPIHHDLPGVMKMNLILQGDVILRTDLEFGYSHRKIESLLQKNEWLSSFIFVDRLDSDSSFFYEWAYAQAVEELCNFQVPKRAQRIREIFADLTVIAGHLLYLARMMRALRFDTAYHYLLREREVVLDLFELLAGARSNMNYLRYGGVSQDISEGFLQRVFDLSTQFLLRTAEYKAVMFENASLRSRLSGLAVLSPDAIQQFNLDGPNVRAMNPLESQMIIAAVGGDALSRVETRMSEIISKFLHLRELVDQVPQGDFRLFDYDRDFSVPAGEVFQSVEGHRGEIALHLISDGTEKPKRVAWRTPSQKMVQAIPSLLKGLPVHELSVALFSLDLSVSEVDK